MGVPKFYRWISERYPCLSEVIKEFQIPEFDNLYLDMNGIIHVCSHPEDDNPHFRITEEKIFSDIFYYIEFLFRMIKPKKVFFMAVDGVAPRAKMNQQRGRRFRSAREADVLEKKARERGEVLPTEKRFDSNCITPGTPFMVRLQDALKLFSMRKVSTDPLWQGVRVYLSGHETPGEGEHKIMDFIRYEKSQPGYDPNTRHCLYGLDADLIMLGLVTHEIHFSLLREEIRYGGKKDKQKRPATPEETTFHLLHMSLMREYLDYEFSSLKATLPFLYDLESIIDDWVLMGFLVGNDFIPHLPHYHIHQDALPIIWASYKKVLPALDGYLNEGGHLNLRRFQVFLKDVAKIDFDKFDEHIGNMKWLDKKSITDQRNSQLKNSRQRKKPVKMKNQSASHHSLSNGEDTDEPIVISSDESADSSSSLEDSDGNDDEGGSRVKKMLKKEFAKYKAVYYVDKMKYRNANSDVLREQTECYVTAIQWNLLYYFEGVPSWSWFYPHHYAPYVSDVTDFSHMSLTYDKSTPLLPFEQLMGVLPAASCELLPLALQNLMLNPNSDVHDFYPVDFKTDLNGKQQDWEAVVLIPFIEEERLLGAMKPLYPSMTSAEQTRNGHGPHYLFVSSTSPQLCDVVTDLLPQPFVNYAKCTRVPMFQFCIPASELCKGKLLGANDDVYYPGFPTLRHIPHAAELKKAAVKVFQHNSRGENMVLRISCTDDRDVKTVSNDMIGQTVYVAWPHLHEAKVLRVSDTERRFELVESWRSSKDSVIMDNAMSSSDASVWKQESASISNRYEDRMGVEIGRTSILIHALPMAGRRYVCGSHGRITVEKQWCKYPVAYALQTTVKDIPVLNPTFELFHSVDELFPLGCVVFMLGYPNYGCQGQVLDSDPKNEGRVKISVSVPIEPNMNGIKQKQKSSTQYYEAYTVAQMLSISSHLISRITGSIFVTRGVTDGPGSDTVNIGLNLKFNKRNEEVPGYTKKIDDVWMYSSKAVNTIDAYLESFPDMWHYICTNNRLSKDVFYELDVFRENGETLRDVAAYLKQIPCSKVKPVTVGTEYINEETVAEIVKETVKKEKSTD